MAKSEKGNQVRTFLWLIQYQIILKFVVYCVSLLPFLSLVVFKFDSVYPYILLLAISLILFPVLLILQTGLLLLIIPKVKTGEYLFHSKIYFTWLRRNIIAEYISTSSLINNLIHRASLLKIMYFGFLGYKSPASLILAPDVKFLDPDLCRFHGMNFIGYGTVISGHTVKGNKLIIQEAIIGRNVKIGSYCKLAVGINIGENTLMDYGVEVGMKTKIGRNVRIFADVKIDDDVVIEDNVIIGKGTLIGRKAIIGQGSYLGGLCRIGSRVKIEPNSKLEEMTDIKQ